MIYPRVPSKTVIIIIFKGRYEMNIEVEEQFHLLQISLYIGIAFQHIYNTHNRQQPSL